MRQTEHMRPQLGAAVIGLAFFIAAGCGDDTDERPVGQPAESSSSTGPGPSRPGTGSVVDDAVAPTLISRWRFVSLQVDGEAIEIEEPLFLDITDRGFDASTTCNDVSGQFGGELMSTKMACGGADAAGERYMSQAFQTEPGADADQLVFDDGEVRLVYESFSDPQPADVFAVLADQKASLDESVLPSAQATGSVLPDFDTLVRVPSPSDDVDVFIGVLNGDVCLVHGTATAIDAQCSPPRIAAASSSAIDIPRYEPPIIRVALIPDRFAAAAAARTELGSYNENILTVRPDAPAGEHLLNNEEGERFLLSIPPPWTDPLAASRTVPDEDLGCEGWLIRESTRPIRVRVDARIAGSLADSLPHGKAPEIVSLGPKLARHHGPDHSSPSYGCGERCVGRIGSSDCCPSRRHS